jgi:hypothetical protein
LSNSNLRASFPALLAAAIVWKQTADSESRLISPRDKSPTSMNSEGAPCASPRLNNGIVDRHYHTREYGRRSSKVPGVVGKSTLDPPQQSESVVAIGQYVHRITGGLLNRPMPQPTRLPRLNVAPEYTHRFANLTPNSAARRLPRPPFCISDARW